MPSFFDLSLIACAVCVLCLAVYVVLGVIAVECCLVVWGWRRVFFLPLLLALLLFFLVFLGLVRGLCDLVGIALFFAFGPFAFWWCFRGVSRLVLCFRLRYF